MKKIIDGKRYDTETATQIASSINPDAINHPDTWVNLYRTPRVAYFRVDDSTWEGSVTQWEVLTEDEATALYETLVDQIEDYETAFPGCQVENA